MMKKTKNKKININNISELVQYLDEQKRILPRVSTKLSIRNQRRLTKTIKRARILGLLPFVIHVKY